MRAEYAEKPSEIVEYEEKLSKAVFFIIEQRATERKENVKQQKKWTKKRKCCLKDYLNILKK